MGVMVLVATLVFGAHGASAQVTSRMTLKAAFPFTVGCCGSTKSDHGGLVLRTEG